MIEIKSTFINVFIMFIDATTLIALIVSAILDSDVSAWILIGIFLAHSLSYHIVSFYVLRLIRRIKEHRIPTPHGRLIDADKLIKQFEPSSPEEEAEMKETSPRDYQKLEAIIKIVKEAITEAPTVVEVEE